MRASSPGPVNRRAAVLLNIPPLSEKEKMFFHQGARAPGNREYRRGRIEFLSERFYGGKEESIKGSCP